MSRAWKANDAQCLTCGQDAPPSLNRSKRICSERFFGVSTQTSRTGLNTMTRLSPESAKQVAQLIDAEWPLPGAVQHRVAVGTDRNKVFERINLISSAEL